MTGTKLASVGLVTARNCMRQQDLDDAKSLPKVAGRTLPQSTTKYYSAIQITTKVLIIPQYILLHKCYSVLQSTTPVLFNKLHCTTKCYSVLHSTAPVLLLQYYSVLQSTCITLYYKVILQYYSLLQTTTPVLLQSTTPILLRTAQYYCNTTLYYKVLLQDYSVVQSTTKYYSSTTPVLQSTAPVLLLLKCYSVLQSTTAVPVCTTRYYSRNSLYYKVLLRTTPVLVTPVLLCTTPELAFVTYETLFTLRAAREVIFQRHQILRLARELPFIIDSCHTWNVIYNVRSNMTHNPTSPNIWPATKTDSHDWSCSHIKNVIYIARSNKSDPPTSPNTAPATQNSSPKS